jgi:hypothetical protein
MESRVGRSKQRESLTLCAVHELLSEHVGSAWPFVVHVSMMAFVLASPIPAPFIARSLHGVMVTPMTYHQCLSNYLLIASPHCSINSIGVFFTDVSFLSQATTLRVNDSSLALCPLPPIKIMCY